MVLAEQYFVWFSCCSHFQIGEKKNIEIWNYLFWIASKEILLYQSIWWSENAFHCKLERFDFLFWVNDFFLITSSLTNMYHVRNNSICIDADKDLRWQARLRQNLFFFVNFLSRAAFSTSCQSGPPQTKDLLRPIDTTPPSAWSVAQRRNVFLSQIKNINHVELIFFIFKPHSHFHKLWKMT